MHAHTHKHTPHTTGRATHREVIGKTSPSLAATVQLLALVALHPTGRLPLKRFCERSAVTSAARLGWQNALDGRVPVSPLECSASCSSPLKCCHAAGRLPLSRLLLSCSTLSTLRPVAHSAGSVPLRRLPSSHLQGGVEAEEARNLAGE